jgi:hypothetical protein
VVVGVGVQRTAIRVSEYPSLVVPELAGLDVFLVLNALMLPEERKVLTIRRGMVSP